MKGSTGLYPVMLDIPQTNNRLQNLTGLISRFLQVVLFTFIVFFSFTNPAIAQTRPDLAAIYKSNNQDSRTMKRELRAEKQSIRAVENISSQTMEKFKNSFPGAQNAEWSVPGEQFVEVQFLSRKNKPMMAYYSFDSHLLGTGHYADYSSLPANAQKFIGKKYKDYTPVKVMWIDLNEDSDEALDLFQTPVPNDGYFVQMKNGNKQIVLQVETDGEVSFFNNIE